ncbi:hypothetical protein DH2020_033058 [Rehmannia glutinosa]|uniref:Uncharacterized protein n=1 Tax=Rehmannia glutinosa TaxID=99300 RepID=A0ABR0VE95_REHGL
MECGGGGSSNNNSCLMAFGENNNNVFCPMLMMPQMGSSSSSQIESGNNTLFLPLPTTNQQLHDLNRRGDGGSSMVVQENQNHSNNNTSTGYYFMESNNNDASNCATRRKSWLILTTTASCLLMLIERHRSGGEIEEACASAAAAMGRHGTSSVGEDPALDQFMEAYCEMLTKYEQELSKPFKEAMIFLSRIECQFKALTLSPSGSACAEAMERNGSSEEEVDVNNSFIDPQAEDRELKGQLLRKYSGYLGSLKQEFMKKRERKESCPRKPGNNCSTGGAGITNGRTHRYESQKLALAESTGLDQKQINNWFINQRKRHWKPSEDMQFVVMDATHPHYYMDNVLGNPFSMDISPVLL